MITDQEVADLIIERFLQEGPFEDAAQCLVNIAIERGSSDNVTMMSFSFNIYFLEKEIAMFVSYCYFCEYIFSPSM